MATLRCRVCGSTTTDSTNPGGKGESTYICGSCASKPPPKKENNPTIIDPRLPSPPKNPPRK